MSKGEISRTQTVSSAGTNLSFLDQRPNSFHTSNAYAVVRCKMPFFHLHIHELDILTEIEKSHMKYVVACWWPWDRDGIGSARWKAQEFKQKPGVRVWVNYPDLQGVTWFMGGSQERNPCLSF